MPGHLSAFGAQEIVTHTPQGEVAKRVGSSFFRGEHCNFNPYRKDYAAPDFLERFLLKGWVPDAPQIRRGTKVTAFGSCFAENITKHLSAVGYSVAKDRSPDIYLSTMGEGLVNGHSLLGQLEWALDGVEPPRGLWHGYRAEAYGCDPKVRDKTRQVLLETGFFVITLGLSEIWCDEETGGVFWRAVPQNHYDPSRHRFRVCSMAETKATLEGIRQLIARHVPAAKLLFTLSPVPLAATFRPTSCLTANSASKAILRAALDEVLREAGPALNSSLFYWPSYEIITDLFALRFGEDGRHPRPEIIKVIMALFEAVHCESTMTLADANQLYRHARAKNAAQSAAWDAPKHVPGSPMAPSGPRIALASRCPGADRRWS